MLLPFVVRQKWLHGAVVALTEHATMVKNGGGGMASFRLAQGRERVGPFPQGVGPE